MAPGTGNKIYSGEAIILKRENSVLIEKLEREIKMWESKASFSEDRLYRFTLYRRWAELGQEILFICLNPSTADEEHNDPTVWRCVNFARDWGYRGVWVGNLFAFRATEPNELYIAYDPVGVANNLALRQMAKRCDKVVYAWGNHGQYKDRGQYVAEMIGFGWCFGVNKTGEPKHPLYQPRNAQLIKYFREVRRDNGRPDQFQSTKGFTMARPS